jgi:hypothetical protein
MNKDYTHELNKEIRSISGGYDFDEEGRIDFNGREVVYAAGNAVVDSACCGTYGCRFAYVPGYLVKWKYRTNLEGYPVSEVEPITDQPNREQLTKILQEKLGVTQVQFG